MVDVLVENEVKRQIEALSFGNPERPRCQELAVICVLGRAQAGCVQQCGSDIGVEKTLRFSVKEDTVI